MQLLEGVACDTCNNRCLQCELYSAGCTKHGLNNCSYLSLPLPTHTYIHTILITATVVGCAVFPMDPSDLATMYQSPHCFVAVARACGEFSCVTQLRTLQT